MAIDPELLVSIENHIERMVVSSGVRVFYPQQLSALGEQRKVLEGLLALAQAGKLEQRLEFFDEDGQIVWEGSPDDPELGESGQPYNQGEPISHFAIRFEVSEAWAKGIAEKQSLARPQSRSNSGRAKSSRSSGSKSSSSISESMPS